MGWEHEPGTVWRAQELYCMDRLSFERVSELTGVATSTLKRWADKYRWRERREELAQVESEIRFNTVMGRKAILQRLLEAEDGKEASQVAFAVASLESLALKQAELAACGQDTLPSPSRKHGPILPRRRTPYPRYGKPCVTRWAWLCPIREKSMPPRCRT